MEGAAAAVGVLMFVSILLLVAVVIFFAQRYKRCPPDKIMVIYGRTAGAEASKVIHGGATLVWPLVRITAHFTYTDDHQYRREERSLPTEH